MRHIILFIITIIIIPASHAYTVNNGNPLINSEPDNNPKNEKAKEVLGVYKTAILIFWLDVKRFPTTNEGLDILKQDKDIQSYPTGYIKGGYLKKIPSDPWGNPYRYENNGEQVKIWVSKESQTKDNSIDSSFGIIIDIKQFEKKYGKY